MNRLALLVLSGAVLAGCASSLTSTEPDPALSATSDVEEARRALERDDVPASADLDDAREALLAAETALEAGDQAEATHQAYLARQGARLASLQAELDEAERIAQTANDQGGARLLVTDAFQTGPRDAQSRVASGRRPPSPSTWPRIRAGPFWSRSTPTRPATTSETWTSRSAVPTPSRSG